MAILRCTGFLTKKFKKRRIHIQENLEKVRPGSQLSLVANTGLG
jgi:hypothetical protein